MGVNVTKYISAVARTVIDVGKFYFNEYNSENCCNLDCWVISHPIY
jgi:hypothetical protein